MKRFALALSFGLVAFVPSVALAIPKVGAAAPNFTLPTATGKTFVLAALKGKPVYLNFFASWCGPCNDEAPAIGKLDAKYHSKGLAIVGVDELESAQKARGFLAEYHLPYVAAIDTDGKIAHDYGSPGLPTHVFIDRKGVVRLIRYGEMEPSDIETAIKSIL